MAVDYAKTTILSNEYFLWLNKINQSIRKIYAMIMSIWLASRTYDMSVMMSAGILAVTIVKARCTVQRTFVLGWQVCWQQAISMMSYKPNLAKQF
jgi:hypothetical protein